MTLVKFCGFTKLEDLEFASLIGVDLVGIILVESSKRYVSLDRAKELISAFEGPKKVAVLKNPELDFAKKVLDSGFELLQLHGSEDLEFIKKIGKQRVIKAFGTCEGFSLPDWCDGLYAVLLDSCNGGGSAKLANWDLASKLTKVYPRIFLAGGLTPQNVSEAIRLVKPFGVDVSSGIETSPGVKDREKMVDFMRGVAGGYFPPRFKFLKDPGGDS